MHPYVTGHIPQRGGDVLTINASCIDDVELAGTKVRRGEGEGREGREGREGLREGRTEREVWGGDGGKRW